MSDDVDVDDVTMNEEIVTTNVTHGSHGHDDKDTSRQKKVTFDTHIGAGYRPLTGDNSSKIGPASHQPCTGSRFFSKASLANCLR
jgi:hypothetical protein